MKCTANRVAGYSYDEQQHRCERELGHGGLHRYTYVISSVKRLQEFPNSEAFFPCYDEYGEVE